MVKINIHVGDQEVYSPWIAVVPDAYLNRDLLLGCDAVQRSNLTWCPREKTMLWGGTVYHVAHVRATRASVRKVRVPNLNDIRSQATNQVQLKEMMRLEPHQVKVIQVIVNEQTGSSLVVYPQPKYSSQTCAMLVEVDHRQTIPVLVDNLSKVHKFIKAGTTVACYDHYSNSIENSVTQVCYTQIENELLPKNDCPCDEGARREKLQKLISEQNWTHLSSEQQGKLSNAVVSHENLVMINSKEMGAISSELAHISVSNPNPCRTPIYRFPEHAKKLISQMLTDMEERGVIEPSSAAWLSPIVLVNKPDGSKRMCLDFRRVNERLAADIHPLPRLEDLVNVASGHQYYATLDLKDAYFK